MKIEMNAESCKMLDVMNQHMDVEVSYDDVSDRYVVHYEDEVLAQSKDDPNEAVCEAFWSWTDERAAAAVQELRRESLKSLTRRDEPKNRIM